MKNTEKTILKKGTPIRESELGQYNFHYPTGNEYEAPTDIVCERKWWVSPKNWNAYQVYVDDKPGRIIWSKN